MLIHVRNLKQKCLHGKQNLCLHRYYIVKTHLCLHGEQLKNTLVYTVTLSIFSNSYIDIHRGFSGLLWPGRDCQEWAYGISQNLRGICFLKDKLTEKTCRIYASFPNLSKSITYRYQILVIMIRLLTDNRKIIKLNLL